MKKLTSFILCLSLIISIALVSPKNHTVNSEAPSSVKDTLSSSQLSYFARVGTGTTVGDSIVRINTAANPSKTTNNLFEGDAICIGNSASTGCTSFTVEDIGNTAYFQINTSLAATNAFITNYIVATRSAQHLISFTPQTNITNGKWQFLIRATSTAGENNQDGMPDQNGFDIGSNVGTQTTGSGARLASADINCPWGGMTVSGIGSTVGIAAANGTVYYYHTIVCALGAGGTNPIGVGATWGIGATSAVTATQIINPSPNHTVANEGLADVYNFFIRHTDSADTLIDGDTARGQIAIVESVRVTATVDPSISFVIDNIGTTNSGAGSSVCPGHIPVTAASRVTATQVPFGSLQLSTFNDLAQRVGAITNAKSGYVVTVYEDLPLTVIGSSETIPDTICNGGGDTCSATIADTWSTASSTPSKFGYSLTAVPGDVPGTMAFNTADSGGNFYKAFGRGAANAQTIFSRNTTPADWERAYVCYRITVTTAQPAGNYENKLTYTATATF